MTNDEADRLIRRMVAAWPHPEPSMDTLQLWREELRRYPFADAVEAMTECESTARFWPSLAVFRDACEVVRRERWAHAPALERGDLPEPNPERLQEVLARFVGAEHRMVSRKPARPLKGRYKVDPETGHAERIEG